MVSSTAVPKCSPHGWTPRPARAVNRLTNDVSASTEVAVSVGAPASYGQKEEPECVLWYLRTRSRADASAGAKEAAIFSICSFGRSPSSETSVPSCAQFS
jgi:hypothetical protein